MRREEGGGEEERRKEGGGRRREGARQEASSKDPPESSLQCGEADLAGADEEEATFGGRLQQLIVVSEEVNARAALEELRHAGSLKGTNSLPPPDLLRLLAHVGERVIHMPSLP
eukprot:755029-Hanusia_phi.AAC.1